MMISLDFGECASNTSGCSERRSVSDIASKKLVAIQDDYPVEYI